MDVTKVSFDIPLATNFVDHSEFVGAVDAVISGWSTTGGALRVTVEGSKLHDSDGYFLAADNTVSTINIQAVLVDAANPTNTVVEDLYTLDGADGSMASLTGAPFVPVVGSAKIFTDAGDAIVVNANDYLVVNAEVVGVTGGNVPAGVEADIHNVTFKMTNLNTDTSDDTAGAGGDGVVLDTDLNVLIDISSYSEADDSAVATKVTDMANTSVVDQVRFYKDGPAEASGTIVGIATLQSADVMTVEELNAFVTQQFG
jgi:hypothetical protein